MDLPIVNPLFWIPAGEPHHVVRAAFTAPPPIRARATSVFPHMHLLGREIGLEAMYPDGTRNSLL